MLLVASTESVTALLKAFQRFLVCPLVLVLTNSDSDHTLLEGTSHMCSIRANDPTVVCRSSSSCTSCPYFLTEPCPLTTSLILQYELRDRTMENHGMAQTCHVRELVAYLEMIRHDEERVSIGRVQMGACVYVRVRRQIAK